MEPNVVLVHGAYAESASWNGVISRLQAAGHSVVAAANPLRGLSGDAEYLSSLLASIDGPIVLAGHSYGAWSPPTPRHPCEGGLPGRGIRVRAAEPTGTAAAPGQAAGLPTA